MPTSAWARAGASLMPSPTRATVWPWSCRLRTAYVNFLLGETLGAITLSGVKVLRPLGCGDSHSPTLLPIPRQHLHLDNPRRFANRQRHPPHLPRRNVCDRQQPPTQPVLQRNKDGGSYRSPSPAPRLFQNVRWNCDFLLFHPSLVAVRAQGTVDCSCQVTAAVMPNPCPRFGSFSQPWITGEFPFL